MSKKFRVSEIFSSIQAEGPTIGTPSIFIRLGGCNLTCNYCDTPYTWVFSEKEAQIHVDGIQSNTLDELTTMDVREIITKVNDLNFGNGIENVVITGGEPLIWNDIMLDLITVLDDNEYRIEIETNGTIIPDESWAGFVDRWNVSPKLENSGVNSRLRNKLEVYNWFLLNCQRRPGGGLSTIFKFVVSVVDDLQEILSLQKKCDIPSDMVWLMPEGRNEQELKDKSDWIIEMCKLYGFRYCPRLQIMLWGNKRGV